MVLKKIINKIKRELTKSKVPFNLENDLLEKSPHLKIISMKAYDPFKKLMNEGLVFNVDQDALERKINLDNKEGISNWYSANLEFEGEKYGTLRIELQRLENGKKIIVPKLVINSTSNFKYNDIIKNRLKKIYSDAIITKSDKGNGVKVTTSYGDIVIQNHKQRNSNKKFVAVTYHTNSTRDYDFQTFSKMAGLIANMANPGKSLFKVKNKRTKNLERSIQEGIISIDAYGEKGLNETYTTKTPEQIWEEVAKRDRH